MTTCKYQVIEKPVLEALASMNKSVSCCVTNLPPFYLHGHENGERRTPEDYVHYMTRVFRGVRRVLYDDGLLLFTVTDSHQHAQAYCDPNDGRRFTEARAAGVEDRAIAIPLNGADTDIMAAAAERLVAECLGRQVDNAGICIGGDVCDLWFRGLKVNVKWTPREDGRMLRTMREKPSDLYVLVTGKTVKEMKIRGWAFRSELEKTTINLGHGETYALAQSELRPFPELASQSGRIKPKDLVGLPWMVAFALRADGWFLIQDIVLEKPPRDDGDQLLGRFERSHEHLFILSKSASYKINQKLIDKTNRSVWKADTQEAFPAGLALMCVLTGCPSGKTVLDPFAGDGSVLHTAVHSGRNAIGIEQDEASLQAIRRKMEPSI